MEEKRDDSLLEMFVFETSQNTEQLEKIILDTEKDGKFSADAINEIFRIMHTIKGSSAMMSYTDMATLAHKAEDLFYYIRENASVDYDSGELSDLILSFADFISSELAGSGAGGSDPERAAKLSDDMEAYLTRLKSGTSGAKPPVESIPLVPKADSNHFKAVLFFEEGCEMENIRAYTIVRDLASYAQVQSYLPDNIIDNDASVFEIRNAGFTIFFESGKSYAQLYEMFERTPFVREINLSLRDMELLEGQGIQKLPEIILPPEKPADAMTPAPQATEAVKPAVHDATEPQRPNELHQTVQSIISVNVSKLDKLMDLVGEVVIAESMVVENPELKGLDLQSFQREALHLHKIIVEMQDMVMSMRLVPLAMTFQKTTRIVRDMSRKLGKEIRLHFTGEETEVDKNIIEHLSDPLLHLVRNSIDHGIESREERLAAGKPEYGTVSLEAYNAGSNVYIIVKDDGRGLDRDKILAKAKKNKLIKGNERELADREIYNMIFLPGFSTSESVTEFSGRGVGMDVVMQNILAVGGAVSVESTPGGGSAVTMKIPLTVAIIDGMNISVGDRRFTIPISAIRESFRPSPRDIIKDTDGNLMVMVRGECYAIIRLHKMWNIETAIRELTDGILIMIEQDEKRRCLFADCLIGQQQVVVKTIPELLKRTRLTEGVSGCTLLGDGSISLILDAGWLIGTDIK